MRHRIIATIIALAFSFSAKAAIAFQSVSSTSSAATTTNFSHTVSAGDDLVLVVQVSAVDGSNPPLCETTAVTFNSIALTLDRCQTTNFQSSGSSWSLINPPVGTYTVTVTKANADQAAMSAMSFTGVHQTDPVPTTNGKVWTAKSSPDNLGITTAYNDSWIVGFCGLRTDDGFPAVGSGQTSRWTDQTTGNPDAGNISARGATEYIATAGAQTDTYTWAVGPRAGNHVVVELREALPTPTPNITKTATKTRTRRRPH
jgi:hypothetical protein